MIRHAWRRDMLLPPFRLLPLAEHAPAIKRFLHACLIIRQDDGGLPLKIR